MYREIIRVLIWVMLVLILLYWADKMKIGQKLKNMSGLYAEEKIDDKSNEYNSVDDLYAPRSQSQLEQEDEINEDPCARIPYSIDDPNQTSMCRTVKIKDAFDEKIDKLSNYSLLKQDSMVLIEKPEVKGHLGNIVNTDQWSYAKEKAMSGGSIYQRDNGVEIMPYDGLENEMAIN